MPRTRRHCIAERRTTHRGGRAPSSSASSAGQIDGTALAPASHATDHRIFAACVLSVVVVTFWAADVLCPPGGRLRFCLFAVCPLLRAEHVGLPALGQSLRLARCLRSRFPPLKCQELEDVHRDGEAEPDCHSTDKRRSLAIEVGPAPT